MDPGSFAVLGIHSTVGQLTELSAKDRGILRDHLIHTVLIPHSKKQFFLQGFIQFLFPFIHVNRYITHHTLRHFQMIHTLHGDRDILYLPVDCFIRTRPELPGKNLSVPPPVWCKVRFPVPPDKPAQAFPHIQEPVLREQIHIPIRGRCPRKTHNPLYHRPDLHQGTKALCLPAFEAGQFIDHQHIPGKRDPGLFHQPGDVFPVNDVHLRVFHQRSPSLISCTDCHRKSQLLQMIPLPDFLRPGIPCYPERRHNQHPPDLSLLQQFLHCRQGNYRLSQAHLQQDRRNRMLLDEFSRI